MPVCITCPLNRSSSSPQSKAAADETICCISQDCKRKDAYSRESLAITYHIPSQVGSVPVPSQVGSVSVCVHVCVCVCGGGGWVHAHVHGRRQQEKLKETWYIL